MRFVMICAAFCGFVGTAHAETLTVLTDRSLTDIRPLIAAYEDKSGTRVQLMRPRDGVREMLEARFANLKADVYLTQDIDKLRELRDAELTEPVQSLAIDETALAAERDPENHWFAADLLSGAAEGRQRSRFLDDADSISGMAMLITTENVAEAKRFLEFLVSSEARAIEADRLNR